MLHKLLKTLRWLHIVDDVDRTELRHKKLVEFMQPRIIVDVGCGSGKLSQRLIEMYPATTVYGCDINDDPGVDGLDFTQIDFDKDGLPYGDGFADIVICSDVIEHAENPLQLIMELSRIAKQSADIYISLPNESNFYERWAYFTSGNATRFQPDEWGPKGHINYMTSQIIDYMFDEAGLKIVDTGGDAFVLYGMLISGKSSPNFSYTKFIKARKA